MNGKNHKIKNNKQKKLEVVGSGNIRITRIPEENVINLRQMMEQKEAKEEQHKKIKTDFLELAEKNWLTFILDKIKNFRIPKIKEEKAPQVKVIKTTEKPEKLSFQEGVEKPEIPTVEKLKSVPILFKISQTKFLAKPLLSFVMVSLLLILPIFAFMAYGRLNQVKGKVLGESQEAYGQLQSAGLGLLLSDYAQAGEKFSLAMQSFIKAQDEIGGIGETLVGLLNLTSSKARSAQYLLKAGQDISEAGDQLTTIIKGLGDIELLTTEEKTQQNINLTDSLSIIFDNLKPIQDKILDAVDNLKKVNAKDIPEAQRDKIQKIQESIPIIKKDFNALSSISEILLQILGKDTQKRYLFLFQNNRELRPTGGFIGALALMDIYQGKIENLEVPGGGSYDVAGQLKEKILAPKPLHLVNPYWNIQDANWFPDFPTSAQKIMWFFERGGGATVDGVITLTPTVIEELLKVVGPIDMTENYGVQVTDENFVSEAQTWAEITYNKEENKPKKFIADLLPLLLDKVSNISPDQLLDVLNVFNNALTEKQILLYFSDANLENKITELGWSGEIKNTKRDYLDVISTNIGGGKTDAVIDQLIEHQAEIFSDGSIVDTVKVTRIHRGNPDDQWEGKINVDYIRFYVPDGSTLLEAEGFAAIPSYRYQNPEENTVTDPLLEEVEKGSIIDEKTGTRITHEFGKTVFGNWMSVGPGESSAATIKYKLPFRMDLGGLLNKSDSYSLFIQKQPGILNDFLISKLTYPKQNKVIWQFPDLKTGENFVQFNADLNTDQYWAVVLK